MLYRYYYYCADHGQIKRTLMKIETYFDKIGESLIWQDLAKYKEAIKNLKNGRYIASVIKVENIRSLEQNNAMWGIPYMYFEAKLIEYGYYEHPSKKDIHEFCMVNCLPEDYKERIYNEWKEAPGILNMRTGQLTKEPFRLTTTKMSTIDSNNYYNNLQNFYAEFFSDSENDLIPDPDPKKKKR